MQYIYIIHLITHVSLVASSLAGVSFVLLCFCVVGFNGAKPRVWCGGKVEPCKRVNGVILSIVELAYISRINQITKYNILDFVKFESYSLKYKSFFHYIAMSTFYGGDGDWGGHSSRSAGKSFHFFFSKCKQLSG